MNEEKRSFQAEVARLLSLMVHSVYTEQEIFLRELISNASDACDTLRYKAIIEADLIADDPDFRVRLIVDQKAKTLEVSDNGIGMDRQELIDNLGTIARSGTSAFLDGLTGDDGEDVSLIGQFGVGFYSVFMVAKKVEVISRKAGDAEAWRWTSDGSGEFTIGDGERAGRGTSVIIYLKTDAKEWLEASALRKVVKKYSDHIALPIILVGGQRSSGDDAAEDADETLNEASALWTRPKKEISADQYKEFYHHVGHAFDDPWLTLHYKAEGKLEYSGLLFVPTRAPFDLFDPARKHRVKLYVKRVFITDEVEGLVPAYLRFLRGVIDSEDLPLIMSREKLQQSPLMGHLRKAVTRRVLSELKKKAKKSPEEYAVFWDAFGAVLKEGIYEDSERRDDLLALARFRSTGGAELTSLEDYLARMKESQKAIYYISGEDLELLAKSPQLEGYRARDVEVLLLTDPVDDFWLSAVFEFQDKPLTSVTRGAADLSDIPLAEGAEKAGEDGGEDLRDAEIATLIALLKQNLDELVKDVRESERLTDSPVCLVADEGDMDMQLARMLKAHGQLSDDAPRILEINPRHALIKALARKAGAGGASEELGEIAHLLLDQAHIIEGEALSDPLAFSRRLAHIMTKGLAA